MKDDDLEEFLFLEDLIFPEEKTDDEDEDGEGEEGEPDGTARRNTRAGTGPRSQPAPSGSGRKNLSPASAMFVARLVFAGIAFFLILLLFLTRR